MSSHFSHKFLDKFPFLLHLKSNSSVSNDVNMADFSFAAFTITYGTVTPIHQSITTKINNLAIANALNTPI